MTTNLLKNESVVPAEDDTKSYIADPKRLEDPMTIHKTAVCMKRKPPLTILPL